MPKRPDYALVTMPNGKTARIPIEHQDPFDLDEAKQFEQTARHRGHTNLLALLHDLGQQGLSKPQAVGVACEYMNLLDRR